MREFREYSVGLDDIELAVVEWPGNSDPVLLLHATGFHSRCWDQVVKRLLGQHVYAVDLRFHGRTAALSAAGQISWPILADDVHRFIDQLGLERLVGVGHSIGGHLLTRVAVAARHRFKQLLLVDPVIMSADSYARYHELAEHSAIADHPVSRRKKTWQHADEMFARFHDKPPFDSWQTEVLRDYCDYALVPEGEDGALTLACDPVNEAALYMAQAGNEAILDQLSSLTVPVTVLRAPPGPPDVMDFSSSPTWPGLADALPLARDVYLPDHNHFIPMQDPALIARYIDEAQADRWHRD